MRHERQMQAKIYTDVCHSHSRTYEPAQDRLLVCVVRPCGPGRSSEPLDSVSNAKVHIEKGPPLNLQRHAVEGFEFCCQRTGNSSAASQTRPDVRFERA